MSIASDYSVPQRGKWVDTRSDRGDIFYPEETKIRQITPEQEAAVDEVAYEFARHRLALDKEQQTRWPLVIGFTGWKGSGKSTLARRLAADIGYDVAGFTDPLRAAVMMLGGLYSEAFEKPNKDMPHIRLGGATPRQAMLAIGIAVRGLNRGMLINKMRDRIAGLDAVAQVRGIQWRGYVIDDIRLPEEGALVRQYGPVLRLSRPGLPQPVDLDYVVDDVKTDAWIDTTDLDKAYREIRLYVEGWKP